MRTITTTLYTFDELPTEAARERARDWWREGFGHDTAWADAVIEDAERMARVLGIEIRSRAYRVGDGRTFTEPAISWALHVQGAGASFAGTWTYRPEAIAEIRAEAPQDGDLHRIAQALAEAAEAGAISAGIADYGDRGGTRVATASDNHDDEADPRAVDLLQAALRNFAEWIHDQLEREWDYQNSDEAVDEMLTINEYEFTEEGKRHA